jgi:anti-anti-sigma factor
MKRSISTEADLRAISAAVSPTRAGATLTIAIDGRFDFNCHQAFRRAYEGVDGIDQYLIDLGKADYIDSSALGMLLLLRENVGSRGVVKIVNANPAVRRILEIANFQRLFPLG